VVNTLASIYEIIRVNATNSLLATDQYLSSDSSELTSETEGVERGSAVYHKRHTTHIGTYAYDLVDCKLLMLLTSIN
jgi:hypothetical protein